MMTKHCEYWRRERVEHIKHEIGLGQIVKENFVRWPNKPYGNYICITDTGVTIVKDEDHETIVTIYVTTMKELIAVYNGMKKIPPYLRKKVQNNEAKYIRNGKTIW